MLNAVIREYVSYQEMAPKRPFSILARDVRSLELNWTFLCQVVSTRKYFVLVKMPNWPGHSPQLFDTSVRFCLT